MGFHYGTTGSSYELGPEAVQVIVRALGVEDAKRIDQDYRDYSSGRIGARHVARFVDRLFCEIQEEIGDPEVNWSGAYWAQAIADLEEEGVG